MKTASRILMFLMTAATGLYAGSQAVPAGMAVSLPQPCTLLLCTAGLAFFACFRKTKRIP